LRRIKLILTPECLAHARGNTDLHACLLKRFDKAASVEEVN
jgi:hypothetical protein